MSLVLTSDQVGVSLSSNTVVVTLSTSDGPTGPAGASAYDVWLAEGNTGTEADFLAALVGPEGPPGSGGGGSVPDGGTTGQVLTKLSSTNGDADWAPGTPGPTGADGATGAQGPQGDPGPAGSQGIQGVPGATGPTGPSGTNGATWLSGVGIPSIGIGVNTDLYLNTSNDDLYQKASGTWALIANIRGAAGAAGSNGATGATGPSGTTGFDPAVITWATVPSSSNLRAAMADETGTGALVFAGGDMGTPSAVNLANATGLPASAVASGTLTSARVTSAADGEYLRLVGGVIVGASPRLQVKALAANQVISFTSAVSFTFTVPQAGTYSFDSDWEFFPNSGSGSIRSCIRLDAANVTASAATGLILGSNGAGAHASPVTVNGGTTATPLVGVNLPLGVGFQSWQSFVRLVGTITFSAAATLTVKYIYVDATTLGTTAVTGWLRAGSRASLFGPM